MARSKDYFPHEHVAQKEPMNIGELGSPEIEVIDGFRISEDYAEIEAFMAERVRVVIMDTSERHAVKIIPIWVNGRVQHFVRGFPIEVRRCYVERLARMRETAFEQDLDPRLGEAMNTLTPHSGLHYPFQVLHDPNPRGQEWLASILAQDE